MKVKIQELRKEAIDLLKNPSIENPSVLAQLATIPAKLQHLEQKVEDIECELGRIDQLIKDLGNPIDRSDIPPPPTNGERNLNSVVGRERDKVIKITINHRLWGLQGGIETIREPKAADSLAKFVTRLYEWKGIGCLEELAKLRVSRGPFVSRFPARDYRYSTGSEEHEYSNKPISDSGYFVLTNSQTGQKASDIHRACQFLRLAPGSVEVEVVQK